MNWLRKVLERVGLAQAPKPTLPEFDGRYLRTQDGQLLRKSSYHTPNLHRVDFRPVRNDNDEAPE